MNSIFSMLALALALAYGPVKPDEKLSIALVPIDGNRIKESKLIKWNIESYFDAKVFSLAPTEIPATYKKGSQDTLLSKFLTAHLNTIYKDSKYDKVIAITEHPLYFSERFPSIRGLSRQNGKPGVVSTFKIKQEAAGDKKFYKSLLGKVSRHEVGHTLGLAHCKRDALCLMTPGVDPKTVYASKPSLCDSCLNLVNQYVK